MNNYMNNLKIYLQNKTEEEKKEIYIDILSNFCYATKEQLLSIQTLIIGSSDSESYKVFVIHHFLIHVWVLMGRDKVLQLLKPFNNSNIIRDADSLINIHRFTPTNIKKYKNSANLIFTKYFDLLSIHSIHYGIIKCNFDFNKYYENKNINYYNHIQKMIEDFTIGALIPSFSIIYISEIYAVKCYHTNGHSVNDLHSFSQYGKDLSSHLANFVQEKNILGWNKIGYDEKFLILDDLDRLKFYSIKYDKDDIQKVFDKVD